jgi:hypothetical protein
VGEPHVHIDHQYVAIALDCTPTLVPAHPFRWYHVADLDDVEMFADTKLIATALLHDIGAVSTGINAGVIATSHR